MGVAECVAPENIHTPGGHFCFRPPHPPGISIPEGVCHTPPPPSSPGISVNFTLLGYPLERIVSKMLLHYIIMQKIIFLR